jgi:hypothetical protein
VDEAIWAAAHYRVERESTGRSLKRKRLLAKAREADLTPEPPGPANDVIRIFDRSGEVVAERLWGEDRSGALDDEHQIVSDLLAMDVFAFRAKYGIASPDSPEAEGPSPTLTESQPPASNAP